MPGAKAARVFKGVCFPLTGGTQFKERLGVRENERVFTTLPLSNPSPYLLSKPSLNSSEF